YISVVMLLGIIAGTLVFAIFHPTTITRTALYLAPVFVVTVVLAALTTKFNNRFRNQYRLHRIWSGYNDIRLFSGWKKWIHPQFLAFRCLPAFLASFAAAQVAIQFGMVLPTSSWYFYRTPIGGLFANLIAFPGLGIIIQVGLCAVLIGLIPIIGMPLAFALNAADYLGIELLMRVAKLTAQVFTYPIALKPTMGQLLGFYTIIAAFIFFDKFFYDRARHGYRNLQQVFAYRFRMRRVPLYGRLAEWLKPRGTRWAATAGLVLVIGMMSAGLAWNPDPGTLRVIMMDLNGGAGTLIMAPGGDHYLVDFGSYDSRRGFVSDQNSIMPVALSNQMETFDGIILTHPDARAIGGLWFILENFNVNTVYTAMDEKAFAPESSIEEFAAATHDRTLIEGTLLAETEDLHKIMQACGAIIRAKGIVVRTVKAGEQFVSNDGFTLTAVSAGAAGGNGPGDASLVLRAEFMNKRILFGGYIGNQAATRLGAEARADVVLAPAHGMTENNPEAFIRATGATDAVIQFQPLRRNDEARIAEVEATEQAYARAGVRVHRTDRSGAVTTVVDRSGAMTVAEFCSLARTGDAENGGDE
ncbi:MAG TPA: ComEC/Rec2 family competence protein, partial [bacterium]|nr:ComEC/Rec2 family competence protein [bacterium]